MTDKFQTPQTLRKFTIIWLGQTLSIIGSGMTQFALSIWVWKLTGHVTDLALFGFFSQLPQIFISLVSGVIVDRANRKFLMVLGDTVTGCLTIMLLILYATNDLQLWHLYLAIAIAGIFEQLQTLAFGASIATLVPKEHYGRASSMGFIASYGSDIIGPALASILFITIGLGGIMAIDIFTFVIAVTTVLFVKIPQPKSTKSETISRKNLSNISQEITFGFRYLLQHSSLFIMLIWVSLFWFVHDIGDSLYSAMILTRTNNDPRILGSLASAAGIGGIASALLLTKWGGFQRRIKGIQLGMLGAGLSKIFFGLGKTPLVWLPTQLCSSFNFPLLGSSFDAIWLSKVEPELQGRVFATRSLFIMLVSALGYLFAGPLADYIFEPAMMPDGILAPALGWLLGTEKGSGIVLLYLLCSLSMLIIGLSGQALSSLKDLDLEKNED